MGQFVCLRAYGLRQLSDRKLFGSDSSIERVLRKDFSVRQKDSNFCASICLVLGVFFLEYQQDDQKSAQGGRQYDDRGKK